MRRSVLLALLGILATSCAPGVKTSSQSSTSPQAAVVVTDGQSAPGTSSLSPSEPGPAQAGLTEIGLNAIRLPGGVAAANEILVWTGDELVFWGGQDDSSSEIPAGEPGQAYNPGTETWRVLSPSPKPPVYGAAGVWTGDRVIICCGQQSRTTVAYDPSTDSWEALPDAPISAPFAEAVWTGREMILVTSGGAASFDPATETWTTAPTSPQPLGRLNEVLWTGREVIVWPADVERQVHEGLAFDPSAGTWRILPEPPAWPAAPDIVWTGSGLIIWGGLPAASGSERAVGSLLDLASETWTELPEALPEPAGCECNLGSQTLLWVGERLIVSTGHFSSGIEPPTPLLLSYEPSTGQWSLLGPSPATSWGADGLTAGERVVFRSDNLYVSEPDWNPPELPIAYGGDS